MTEPAAPVGPAPDARRRAASTTSVTAAMTGRVSGVSPSRSGSSARASRRRTGSGAVAGRRSPRSCCSRSTPCALLAVGISALVSQAGGAALLDEANPIRHDTYWSVTSTLVMLFCAAQAPELFGRDQRYGVLPLYFSRVLTRIDYALARTGGLFLAILIVTLTPQLLLSIGAILAAPDPVTGLREELPEIPRYLAVCLLGSAVFAGVSSVVASYTPRRAYSVAAIIALFIVPPIVVSIIAALSVPDIARVLLLVSPSDVVDGVNAAVYGPLRIGGETFVIAELEGWVYVLTALVYAVGSLAIVVRRYLTVTV